MTLKVNFLRLGRFFPPPKTLNSSLCLEENSILGEKGVCVTRVPVNYMGAYSIFQVTGMTGKMWADAQ